MRKATRNLTKDPIVLRILEQIKLQGKTEREVEAGIGLGVGAFTRWKYENSKSYMMYIGKIADYLNLTTEYLLGTERNRVNENVITDVEIRLIEMYRKMDDDERKCLLQTANLFIRNKEVSP